MIAGDGDAHMKKDIPVPLGGVVNVTNGKLWNVYMNVRTISSYFLFIDSKSTKNDIIRKFNKITTTTYKIMKIYLFSTSNFIVFVLIGLY